jgi:hypothetical protein
MRKKGKEEIGADRWGRPVREKEGERARAGWRRAERSRLRAGEGRGMGRRGKGSQPKGKKRSRPGWLGWSALYQIFSYLLF